MSLFEATVIAVQPFTRHKDRRHVLKNNIYFCPFSCQQMMIKELVYIFKIHFRIIICVKGSAPYLFIFVFAMCLLLCIGEQDIKK